MVKYLHRVAGLAAVLSSVGAPLWAQSHGGGHCWWRCSPTPVSVPEIDASAGLLAVAAVVAILLFIRERRKAA
jgi:hypothetical protein